MFFNSVKEINWLRNEINRLLSKEMWLFLMFFNSIKEISRLRKEMNRLSGPILEFKGNVRHFQKGHPTLVKQVDLIL